MKGEDQVVDGLANIHLYFELNAVGVEERPARSGATFVVDSRTYFTHEEGRQGYWHVVKEAIRINIRIRWLNAGH